MEGGFCACARIRPCVRTARAQVALDLVEEDRRAVLIARAMANQTDQHDGRDQRRL
jgi:hypothetical protein